jgi:hypothetical protein
LRAPSTFGFKQEAHRVVSRRCWRSLSTRHRWHTLPSRCVTAAAAGISVVRGIVITVIVVVVVSV